MLPLKRVFKSAMSASIDESYSGRLGRLSSHPCTYGKMLRGNRTDGSENTTWTCNSLTHHTVNILILLGTVGSLKFALKT